MVQLTLPPGDYTIRSTGAGVEILSIDRDIPREEVAAQLGRTERSIDVYRTLTGPAQLKSSRVGGRVFIKQSELSRWIAYIEAHPDELLVGNRPRKKRRPRLAFGQRRSKSRTISQSTPEFSTTT
jgi:hypothetical protein